MDGRYVGGPEMAVVLAVVASCAVAALRGARRTRAVRRRAARLWGGGPPSGASARMCARTAGLAAAREGLPAAAAAVLGIVLVGGPVGWAVGALAASGVWWWRRRAGRAAAGEPEVPAEEVARQLPLAADLMAACLAAGAGPREAAEAVGGSLGGPVGDRLARAAAEVRLGAEPAVAWERLAALPGARGLALCLERAQATGVPAVDPMARLAVTLRAVQSRSAGIRARRAGVVATAPLGLCFLPAFLAVGVVPMVIGLASGLLRVP
ncbi:type II secretion system F family protein [Streptomyces sp. AV19]|uniref:type II secretion system F family protein n=1 Tax=Streptomyces sp. AV19 TaxID=2793068 RepID=UPI0018FE7446|nr:type II secretion system F family protein [Streptomyces sp. AV19]MBH1934875.1 type II secretion system F family protein [Streptomyces sp. AV19]MDG4537009.1 type II secretion system F family protein [Streptomyces sp. AV19]